jgi:phosphopantetheine adenylyltransferase
MKKLVFSFGRFNPPTTGHEVLLKKVVAVAKKENADAMVYSSQSNDPKKNPLPYKEKTKFMKAMFPKHKKVIQYDVGVKNAFDTLSTVYAKGYRDVTMVVGSDRVTEFEKILNKYNDVEGRHGYYNFESGVKVVSAGARDPDAEGVTGMSASKMRAAAAANDFESFEKGMPAGFKGGQSVFDAVRKGMNLSEEMMEFMESDIEGLREFFETDLVDSLCVIDDVELFEFLSESTQNGLIGLDQIKKFESVVDKLFAKYDIDFNFTRHFGDRMDDSRNNPSITLKELAEFIKKMYKRQGKSIKSVAGAEAVLKDIQSDLNIPVAVTYDRNNDEFDVVLKTIMRKKNFTSPDKVIKYEENDMTNQLPEGFMDAMKQLVPGARNPQKPQEGKKTAMEMQFPYARLSVHRMIVALRKARGTAMKGKAQGKDRRENERSLGYILAHVEDIARTRHAEQPNSGRQIHDTKNIDDATQQYFMDKIRQNDWTKTDQEILNAMVGNGTDDNTKGGAYHARTLAHDIALSVKYAKKDAGIKESVELDELKIDMPKKGAGLGITRDKMPQVDEKDYPEYFAYLKEKGITLKKGKEDPNNLKPIQKEFAKIGVEKSLDKMLAQKDKAKFIIVSKDDYIVDGHHRWLAAKNGRQQLNVMRANVNMKELLKATNEFPKTTFKSIKNVVKNMQEVRQDSDIKDKKGTQPAKYYASDADGDKMSKSTKEKRAVYFAKGGSKKPAPGDKGKKTKESEHTKKYRQMFGETKPCWDGYTQQGMKKKGGKMVPNCVPEETVNEEKIDGLVKKSEKSGISYGILKKVYDRGMAAWKSGHRPGTTAQQWAFARVNSFVTKGKGTWGKADKDLAAKVRSESFLPFSVDEDRDYKKERENYLGTPKQMERNAARSRARRLAIKKGIAERGDGRDIHHKDNNPMNNDPKNLSSVTQKYNRTEPRKRK